MPPDLTVSFTSFHEWSQWQASEPELRDQRYIQNIVALGKQNGVTSRFLGPISSQEVVVVNNNYRESFLARGLNPRLRAMLDLLAEHPRADDIWNLTIYAPEALTPFALVLRGKYARFLGSEYADGAEKKQTLFPIPFQDLLQLDFASNVFDLVISNEVFEHVPDLSRALLELARILKTGGTMLATFPFGYDSPETVVKAWFAQDQLQFAGEPEYHGNPADPDKGSLVFQIPGWDILPLCKEAGFRQATLEFISSIPRGITGAEIAGIFVLRAIR